MAFIVRNGPCVRCQTEVHETAPNEWRDDEGGVACPEAVDGNHRPYLLRTPDEVLADFDAGCRGQRDIDMRGVLIEVILDITTNFHLAMKDAGIPGDVIAAVQEPVNDYIVRHYHHGKD